MTYPTDDDLDLLIADITADAHDEDEQHWGFLAAMEDLYLPVVAEVIEEKVDLLEIHYDGNPQRGLVAVCKRKGRKHVVCLIDIVVEDGSVAQHLAAYRRWLGIDAKAEAKLTGRRAEARPFDPSAPVEAVLLKVGEKSARIRLLQSDEEVTLRAKRYWAYVPGQVITIKPRKRWSFSGYACMSGEIAGARIDIPALGLVPLRVGCIGCWEPAAAAGYSGDLADLWDQIASMGPRDEYEVEWVTPGFDPDRDDMPPVAEANELYLSGDREDCRDILSDVLAKDLRCIEAHSLLGTWDQEVLPDQAVVHFEVAVALIDFALGNDFDGVIPWQGFGNRSMLVTLYGYAGCLWQLGRLEEAKAVFERLLWLNPTDSVGAGMALLDVRAGMKWEDRP